MMQQTPWWKGIKFWITFLLAAYAAAAVTWILLRNQEDAGGTPEVSDTAPAVVPPPASRADDPPVPKGAKVAPAVVEPAAKPVGQTSPEGTSAEAALWRPRIRGARRLLVGVMRNRGTPDPQSLGDWVATTLLPDLDKIWTQPISREQIACLAQLEWSLAQLTHRISHPDKLDRVSSVAELDARLAVEPVESVADVAYWVASFRARGAEDLVQRVLTLWIRGTGEHDARARTLLGYTEFQHAVHPDLAFRRHPFIRIVERANEKRWFRAEETQELESARAAAKQVDEHYKRVLADTRFRAVENLKANLYERGELNDLYMLTHWADPFLVCYVSARNLGADTCIGYGPSRSDQPALRKEQRRVARTLMESRGRLYQAVHREFDRRWAKALAFRPLMDPYGGRPDYPVNIRSYAEGCPLVVWLLDDGLMRHASAVLRVRVQSNVRQAPATFQQRPGRILAMERGLGHTLSRDERETQAISHARAAARQVWYWSIRQRNNWGRPPNARDFGSEALVAQLCALKNDGTEIGFGTWRGTLLEGLQKKAKHLRDQGRPGNLWLPLSFLVDVTHLGQLNNFVAKEWGIGGVGELLYEVHAAAFAELCMNSGDARLENSFTRWMDLIAHGEGGTRAGTSFREAFRISGDDDFEDIQERLNEVLDRMLKADPAKFRYIAPEIKAD